MSGRISNKDLGLRPGAPRRLVEGLLAPRTAPLANQIKAQWVDSQLNKYQIVECLDDCNNTYSVFVRAPSADTLQNDCYFCVGTRHNPANDRCQESGEDDWPADDEWALVRNKKVRVTVTNIHEMNMIGTSKAGSGVVSFDRRIY